MATTRQDRIDDVERDVNYIKALIELKSDVTLQDWLNIKIRELEGLKNNSNRAFQD